jgi:predicted dehydrogenase
MPRPDDDSTGPRPTRRGFLRTTAAGVGAAATVVPAVHAAGTETIRVGLIGCGGRGSGAANDFLAAHPANRLTAVADIFPERLASAVTNLRGAKKEQVQVDPDHQFVGLDGYRKVIDSGVDVVLVACASKFHPIYTKAALEAGKHVFCEKPHAVDAAGYRALVEATALADQKKLNYVSGLMSRYGASIREAAARIKDGAIGRIVAARVNYLRAPYVVRTPQPGDTETIYQFRNWYHFAWLSGDDVSQSLVHNMDRIAFFMDEAQPTAARGVGGRSASFGRQYGDQFDHHSIVYEYDDDAMTFAACTQQSGCSNDSSDIVMGTKGRFFRGRLYDHEGNQIWRHQGEETGWWLQEQIELSDAIRNGRTINNGHYAAESSLTCVLGQVACYTGQRLTREKLIESNFTFGPRPEECRFDMPPPAALGSDDQYPVPVPGVTRIEDFSRMPKA